MPLRSTLPLVVLLALSTACDAGGGRRLPLRDGVSLVYEGPAIDDPDCLFRTSEPGICSGWIDVMVRDAERDGDRVAVVATAGNAWTVGVLLAESDDLGRTWRSQLLGSPPTGWNGSPSLYLADGRTFLMWIVWTDGPLGGRPLGATWEITGDDPAHPYVETYDTGIISQLVPSADGRARFFPGPVDQRDPSSGTTVQSWAPGEASPGYGMLCVGRLGCSDIRIHTADGVLYSGTFDSSPTEYCTFEWSIETGRETIGCVPWDTWPARDTRWNDPPSTLVLTPDGAGHAARFYERGGHAIVQPIHAASGSLLPEIDLGPGRPAEYTDRAAYAAWLPRFPGLAHVIRDDELALMRVRDGGTVDEVSFPRSPCTSLEECAEVPTAGFGQAQLALPLGGDEHLVFYVVDSFLGDTANHQWLYVSRERFTYTMIVAGTDPDVTTLFPDARPASAIERMCLRAASCYPTAITVPECTGFWRRTSNNEPGADAALARFLATTPGCAGFDETWPELAFGMAECPSTCWCDIQGYGVDACSDAVPCGIACTRRGGTCSGGTCSLSYSAGECDTCTASGSAVSCWDRGDGTTFVYGLDCAAGGLTCESCTDGTCGPHCADRGSCPSDGARCEGDIAVSCYQGGESRDDCGAAGEACDPSTGACALRPGATACGPAGSTCVGNTLVSCGVDAYETRSYASCTELGFTRCVAVDPSSGFGRCE